MKIIHPLNKKTVVYGLLVAMMMILLFFIGWFIGAFLLVNKSTDNTISIDEKVVAVEKQIQDVVAPQIIATIQNKPSEIPILQTCITGNNCTALTGNPPYQWIRYAQYYSANEESKSSLINDILDDLIVSSDFGFENRLYQYGDIIIDSKTEDIKYQNRYLDILDKISIPDDFIEKATYTYNTKDNPPVRSKDVVGPVAKGGNNAIYAMGYSNNVLEVADAYKMTHNAKYLSAMNNFMNELSYVSYVDGVAGRVDTVSYTHLTLPTTERV